MSEPPAPWPGIDVNESGPVAFQSPHIGMTAQIFHDGRLVTLHPKINSLAIQMVRMARTTHPAVLASGPVR